MVFRYKCNVNNNNAIYVGLATEWKMEVQIENMKNSKSKQKERKEIYIYKCMFK